MTGRGKGAARCRRCGGILSSLGVERGEHVQCKPRQPTVIDRSRTVGLSMRQEHLDGLDELARRWGRTRSGVVQRLIEYATVRNSSQDTK